MCRELRLQKSDSWWAQTLGYTACHFKGTIFFKTLRSRDSTSVNQVHSLSLETVSDNLFKESILHTHTHAAPVGAQAESNPWLPSLTGGQEEPGMVYGHYCGGKIQRDDVKMMGSRRNVNNTLLRWLPCIVVLLCKCEGISEGRVRWFWRFIYCCWFEGILVTIFQRVAGLL